MLDLRMCERYNYLQTNLELHKDNIRKKIPISKFIIGVAFVLLTINVTSVLANPDSKDAI